MDSLSSFSESESEQQEQREKRDTPDPDQDLIHRLISAIETLSERVGALEAEVASVKEKVVTTLPESFDPYVVATW